MFFLKAASLELGIQEALTELNSSCRLNSAKSVRLELPHNKPVTLCQRYETLMFYCLLQGRRRPCHLKSYNASDLLALTGQSYAFATLDDHLREAMTLHLSAPIGDALARQYYRTWYQRNASPQESLEPYVFYLDAHQKPVFSKKPVPVGMIKGQPGTCLRQVFLHGRRGHTLYCRTYPGDFKLSKVAKEVISNFEQALGHKAVYVVVIDREGMSIPLFRELSDIGVYIVTLLKSNQ